MLGAFLGVVAVVGLLAALVGVLAWLIAHEGDITLGGRTYRDLEFLVRTLGRVLKLPSVREGNARGIYGVTFEGPLEGSGRHAKVSFALEHDDQGGHTSACFEVSCDDAPLLKVSEETPFVKLQLALGTKTEIEVGNHAFDSRFLLETPDPKRARRALRPDLREEIARAFDAGAVIVMVGDGAIQARARARSLEPRDYARILAALDRAARCFDRKKIEVQVLGGERHALVDESGKTRCPYCHGGITGAERDLVACEKCGTVLHAGCWSEHGGCPLLGCTGEHPERPRVGESSA